MSKPNLKRLKLIAAGTAAMLKAQADLPPAIVQILRVLLDRDGYPAGHVQWIERGACAILTHWDKNENLEELAEALGLKRSKKRRHAITMRSETEIAAAIVQAAVAGEAKPLVVAATQLEKDDRQVQRAWKRWRPVYLARLTIIATTASAKDAKTLRAAIRRL